MSSMFSTVSRRFSVLVLLFCLFLSLAVVPRPVKAGVVPPTRAIVKVSGLNVRKAPTKRSRRLFGLSRHTRVEVLEERGSWVKIRTRKGREGWAFRPLLKIIRPKKRLPEISLELNNVSPEVGPYFSGAVAVLKKNLQSYFPQLLNLVVSRDLNSSSGKHWLMALEIPFSREDYRELKGDDVGEGTIDLLPFLKYLHGLLLYRDAVFGSFARNPYIGPAEEIPAAGDVACYLNLVKDSHDILFLTGKMDGPFAVFDDYLFIKAAGYRPLKIKALLPGCVRDFNKFILPEPYSYDGRRTTAAAVYDFFGFSY